MSGRRAAEVAFILLAISLLSPSYAQDGAKLCANGGTCLAGIATACSCAGSDAEVMRGTNLSDCMFDSAGLRGLSARLRQMSWCCATLSTCSVAVES